MRWRCGDWILTCLGPHWTIGVRLTSGDRCVPMDLQLGISRGGPQGDETPEVVRKTTCSPSSRLCWLMGVCMEASPRSPGTGRVPSCRPQAKQGLEQTHPAAEAWGLHQSRWCQLR